MMRQMDEMMLHVTTSFTICNFKQTSLRRDTYVACHSPQLFVGNPLKGSGVSGTLNQRFFVLG